jgi:tyrosine-specific transport protein
MNFIKALSVFLGTIIGAGIFGLPYVASKAGFFVVLIYFFIMSFIVISFNLIYSQVILGTKENCRLPGYIGKYLGDKWEKFSFIIVFLGGIGALLAYLIISGEFLSYSTGLPVLWSTLLFFFLGSFLVFKGIKSISGIELALLVVLLIILGIFFIKAFPSIDLNKFQTINLEHFILPYGVVLFSLGGASIIPELKEMTKGKNLKKLIVTGVVLSALIYLFFIYIVLGASSVVSKDAISGMTQVLGPNIVKLGFIFGIIACFTSFLTLGLTLQKVLWYDLGVPKNISWFLVCFIPLLLFLLGVKSFINVISFTGAVSLAIEGSLMVFLYRSFLKKKLRKNMNPLYYLLIGIFFSGMALEIISYL